MIFQFRNIFGIIHDIFRIHVSGKFKELLNGSVTISGINGLLEVAGTIAEHDTLPITANSRQHASVALAKIYDDLHSDTERQQYRDLVDEYFT